jgi:hypothetical protein
VAIEALKTAAVVLAIGVGVAVFLAVAWELYKFFLED